MSLACPCTKHGRHTCQHQPWCPSILVQELPCAWAATLSRDFRGCPWNPSDGWGAAWAGQGKQRTGESYKVSTHLLSCDFIHEVSGEDCITMGFTLLSVLKLNKIGILCWKTTSENTLKVSHALVYPFRSLSRSFDQLSPSWQRWEPGLSG